MTDIFISYAREDKGRVEILANALEAHGWSVWWDPHIPTGKRFNQVIEEALAKARCIIVVWSTHSISSRYVMAEANEGADREVLVPVFIEEVKVPLLFREIQTLNLVDWQGSPQDPNFKKLVEDIEVRLGVPSVLPKTAADSYLDVHAPIETRPGFLSKNARTIRNGKFSLGLKVLGAVGASALLVALVVWVYYSQSNQGSPPTTNVNLATPTPQLSPPASPQPDDLSDLVKHFQLIQLAFYQGPCAVTEPSESILDTAIAHANVSQTRWYVKIKFPRPSRAIDFVVIVKFYDSRGITRGVMSKQNAYAEPEWVSSWHCSDPGLDRGGLLPKGTYKAKVFVGPSRANATEVGARSIKVY